MNVSSQSKGFSKQVEDLCQHLLKKTSIFSLDEAQDVIQSLIQTLLLVENHLVNTQEADLTVSNTNCCLANHIFNIPCVII